MRRFVSKLVACVLFALSIGAASNLARATDYADLWWNPTESGWGLQTAQQGNSMFITFYVFGPDRNGTWFNGLMFATTPRGTGVHRRPVPGDGTLLRRAIHAACRQPQSGHGDVPGDVADDGERHLHGRWRHGHEGGRAAHARLAQSFGELRRLVPFGAARLCEPGVERAVQRLRPVHDRARSACPPGDDHRHPERQPRQLHAARIRGRTASSERSAASWGPTSAPADRRGRGMRTKSSCRRSAASSGATRPRTSRAGCQITGGFGGLKP